MKVQLVSSLSNLCFLYCCLEVQVVLRSKSFVFYIVKKWWLKILLVPKCVGNRLQVIQKLVLFQRIRFWMFDQMKIFLNWIGMWPFRSKQLRSLGKCLYFENKEKPKQLLGQYNCSSHLSTGETGSWHQSVAQMMPPQLTFLWLPKNRQVNELKDADWTWVTEKRPGFSPERGAGKSYKQYLKRKRIGEK